jgi:hypothetical protein
MRLRQQQQQPSRLKKQTILRTIQPQQPQPQHLLQQQELPQLVAQNLKKLSKLLLGRLESHRLFRLK